MNALLWTLAGFGAAELLSLAWCMARNELPESTPFSRALGLIHTVFLGLWAAVLLVKGGAL